MSSGSSITGDVASPFQLKRRSNGLRAASGSNRRRSTGLASYVDASGVRQKTSSGSDAVASNWFRGGTPRARNINRMIDPMLATGGSAVAALDLLANLKSSNVRIVNLVAAPEGIRRVRRHYPKVPIFTAAVDERLNGRGYIIPGLGDAGDRLFGV